MAVTNRAELIDFLLKRRFGTLAPPPVPTLRSAVDLAFEEAKRRRTLAISGTDDSRSPIQAAREEYGAMPTEMLRKLVEDAKSDDARKAQELAAEIQVNRESRWPHWAKKDLWSEAELAALCCGLVPDERGMPGDPGKIPGTDTQAVAINRAADDIRRGTLSGKLPFVPRDDADNAARMYGTARHYVPEIAAEWAADRFRTFPTSLLAAVRERSKSFPKESSSAKARWPWGDHETELLRKLAAAAEKFWKLYDPGDASTAPTNEAIVAWLKEQGVADRNAQVMATILRADGLPPGPRR